MRLQRKAITIGIAVVLFCVLGVSQLQAQDQVVTWREQIAQILAIVLDIQSGVQDLTNNAVSRQEVQAMETRIEVLERIIGPTATPTITPYQKVRDQEEQSLHRELIQFLYQQDIAVFEDNEEFMSIEDYVDDIMDTVVILAERCEISVYEMVNLIDLEAKRREEKSGGGPSYYSSGIPYMARLGVASPWLFSETKSYCQGE